MNAPMHGILAPLFNFSDFVMITPRDLKMQSCVLSEDTNLAV